MTEGKEDTQEGAKEKEVKTITSEFEGYGKFTVRGLKAGEKLKIQDKAMTVDQENQKMDLNLFESVSKEIQTVLVDSPKGPHPPIPYITELPSGIVDSLRVDIVALSTPSKKTLKN